MTQVADLAATNAVARPGYKWAVVGMLWFICFFNYADRQAIFSIFPVLQERYGFDEEQLGRIGAAFTWVYALSAPFAGQVGDRLPRKFIILGGLYVWSAITGFTALCSKVWHFVLVRASEGLGETFYFPASMSLVSDYHSPRTRSRAMSLHQTSVYAGTIGGGALAGWMAQNFGWQSPFVLLGALGILLGLVLAAFIREPQRDEAEIAERNAFAVANNGDDELSLTGGEPVAPEPTRPPISLARFLAELARTPTALTLMMAFFGANFVALVFLTWMPKFLHDKFSLNLAWAGLGATVFIQLASAAGSVLGGVLADRWRKRLPGGRMAVQATGTLLGARLCCFAGRRPTFKC